MASLIGLLLAIWAGVSLTLAGITLFYTLMFGAVAFLGSMSIPGSFPGDPPLFDLLIVPVAFASCVSVPLCAVIARLRRPNPRGLSSLGAPSAAASVVVFAICAGVILERQDARWAAVRNGIREYGDAIGAAAGDRDRTLTSEEFEGLKQRLMPRPVSVDLRG